MYVHFRKTDCTYSLVLYTLPNLYFIIPRVQTEENVAKSQRYDT